MKRAAFILSALTLILIGLSPDARAQSDETKRFEVGAHFTSFTLGVRDSNTEPGLGGRLTFNLNNNIALEAEGDFFPREERFRSFRTGGRIVEGLFGVKIGKRYKRFGIFGKARPGLVSFSEGKIEFIPSTPTATTETFFNTRTERQTHFAADLGAVLELYVSRRVFARFDAGDTIIHYGQSTDTIYTGVLGGTFTPIQFPIQSDTTHNFQFSAGVGFRF